MMVIIYPARVTVRAGRKAETRDRILEAAARLLRERGFEGVGVAEIMDQAGLTHGGFYAHFASKADLLRDAFAGAARAARARYFGSLGERRGAEWVRGAVRRYLSRSHRDDPGGGCPYPALGNDTARRGADVRRVMDDELRKSARGFEINLEEAGVARASDRALALLSLCAGGVALARAVHDPKLSEQILTACRQLAMESLPEPAETDRAARQRAGKESR